MTELEHIDMELLSTFINRAGHAFNSYGPDSYGYYDIRVPEFIGEQAPLRVRDLHVGRVRGRADADLVVAALNNYITATKRLMGVTL